MTETDIAPLCRAPAPDPGHGLCGETAGRHPRSCECNFALGHAEDRRCLAFVLWIIVISRSKRNRRRTPPASFPSPPSPRLGPTTAGQRFGARGSPPGQGRRNAVTIPGSRGWTRHNCTLRSDPLAIRLPSGERQTLQVDRANRSARRRARAVEHAARSSVRRPEACRRRRCVSSPPRNGTHRPTKTRPPRGPADKHCR
jgi:hypothetical protein